MSSKSLIERAVLAGRSAATAPDSGRAAVAHSGSWRLASPDASPPDAYGTDVGPDLNQLLNVLFRRRWLIGGTVFASLLIASVVVFQVTPRFTAETRILVDSRNDRIAAIESVIPGLAADEASVNSQVELLRSRDLARKVMQRLNLLSDAEFNAALRPPTLIGRVVSAAVGSGETGALSAEASRAASDVSVVDAMLRRLNVQVLEGSRIIALSFSSEDSNKAATIANAFTDEYLTEQLEAKFDATRRANTWLDETVSELRARVAASERAVEDFRRASGLVESEGVTLISQQVSGVNTQLIVARAATAEARARLQEIRGLVNSSDDVATASEVLDSPLIQRLREQQATVERELAELASEFGPLHPTIVQFRADAEDLDAKIAQEVDKIVQRLENEVRVASAREESLSTQLERLTVRVGDSNEQQIQLRALEREAEANRNLLAMLLARYKEVSAQSGEGVQQPDARIISLADVPLKPSYPDKKVVLGLVFIGSIFLACAIAFAAELRDRTFRSGDEIERALGIPALGLIPLTPNLRDAGKAGQLNTAFYRANSAFGESLHTLDWNLTLANSGQPPSTVLITSAQPGEGKTTIALGLANSQAIAGRKVLLIDADTRKPAVHRLYGMPETSGLLDVLRGSDVSPLVLRKRASGLHVLTAGRSTQAALSLLESSALDALLEELTSSYDLIVLDSPPVMAVADACLLSRKVESTVLVVRWASTRREVVEHCIKQLRRSGAMIAGVLLSMVDVQKHAGYLYGDSGRYHGRLAQYHGE